MRSRPSLLLMRNLRSLAVVVLATLPCVAFAQWRVVAVSTEVDKMRFNTIIDAHSFMKNYRSGEEQGKGTPVGDALYPVASYGDGRYVSRICFKYLGATGDYDPTTCTGDPATVYWRSPAPPTLPMTKPVTWQRARRPRDKPQATATTR